VTVSQYESGSLLNFIFIYYWNFLYRVEHYGILWDDFNGPTIFRVCFVILDFLVI
jgi:hypothetical protein